MKRTTLAALALAALWVCGQFLGAADSAAVKRILYITTTKGFHHSACEYSIPVIKKMAEESKKDPLLGAFDVVCTDKTDLITAEGLKGFDAICFSNTTGDLAQFPLNEADRNAGPFTVGQRYPEPKCFVRMACRIVRIPPAIMERLTKLLAE